MTIGDFLVSKSKDVDPFVNEVALMKQLIMERTHPLELLRELISNAGAQEVGASHIRVTYYVHPEYGHVFEVGDDGCGMDFTNNPLLPGRLDRFLGLGLSAISGLTADEFAWKGLGSKLAYQSRRIEIETYNGRDAYSAVVNEPWSSIERGKKPSVQATECPPPETGSTGTTVRVFGHPPHRHEDPHGFDTILNYLMHRTFVGFTRARERPPRVALTVQGRREDLQVGFPELLRLPAEVPEGTVSVVPPIILNSHIPGTSRDMQVLVRGFYTWDEGDYELADVRLNTGMVLSVKGIPYFGLDMKALGSGQLAVANPGPGKCCLIVECDSIQSEMNISRSGLVDAAATQHFRQLVAKAIRQIEDSPRHREFRLVPQRRKERRGAGELRDRKEGLAKPEQAWVYWQPNAEARPLRLLRVPENETDTLAVLWKLEVLGALPFATFETLAYSGTGADLVLEQALPPP